MNVHGGDVYAAAKKLGITPAQCLDFSANINPLGMPQGVYQAMVQSLPLAVYYPDPKAETLIQALSCYYQQPPERIVAGNGAADLIYRLVQVQKPRKALLPVPSFAEYEQALEQSGTEICYYQMGDGQWVLTEDFLTSLTAEQELLFLCNPNNPTGTLISGGLLLKIVKKAQQYGIIVVIDECFLDFTGAEQDRSFLPQLTLFPNVFVLKSFTKMFAVPGVRIGYGFCSDRQLIARLNAAGQCWPVNVVAAAAACACLKEQQFIRDSISLIKCEREYLLRMLRSMGIMVYPGRANFLMFYLPEPADLYDRLLEDRIIIRRCNNYRGLRDGFYRIAVLDHQRNERFCSSLAAVLKRTGGTTDDSKTKKTAQQ